MTRQYSRYELFGYDNCVTIYDNLDGFMHVPTSVFIGHEAFSMDDGTSETTARAIFAEFASGNAIQFEAELDSDRLYTVSSPDHLRGVKVSESIVSYMLAMRLNRVTTTETFRRRRPRPSLVECAYCLNEFDPEDMQTVYDDHEEDHQLCPTCYDEVSTCPQCGRWIRCGCQSRRGRDGQTYCCEDCLDASGQGGAIHRYNYVPEFKFYGDPKDAYLGVELEVDHGDDAEDLALAVSEDEHLYCMHDGSLDEGVEIASMPMTLDEHVSSDVWQLVRTESLARRFKSHDTRTCGLHVHVNRSFFGESSRARCAAYYKLMRLVQRFEEPIKLFSRRHSDRYASFAGRCWKNEEGSIFNKGERIDYYYRDEKYMALNFTHSETIEFRVFKGTLRVETILATLAFVDGMARAAKKRGERWIEDVTWYDLCEWIVKTCGNAHARKCLEEYLAARQLLGDAEAAGEEE